MKEIEILVEVYSNVEEVVKALEQFEYLGKKETIDTYYYDPLRKNLKPNIKNHIDLKIMLILLHIKLINLMIMVNGYILMNMKQQLMIYIWLLRYLKE